jgi:hypothetical protein
MLLKTIIKTSRRGFAISPLDDRYLKKVETVDRFFSEKALMELIDKKACAG